MRDQNRRPARLRYTRFQPKRRAMALVAVLVVTALVVTLASTFIASTGTTTTISRNIGNHARARRIAESGIRMTMAYIQATSTWRGDKTNGTWVTNQAFASGTFTVVGTDGEDLDGDGVISNPAEGDGDLADDTADLLTLTVTGTFDGATQVARAVVTPVPGDCMVGHWKLDETSGTVVLDSSGNDNHGVLYNMDPGTDWVSGQINGALEFDGSNDYVQIPHSPELNGETVLTYSAWVYPHNWSGIRQIMAKSVHGGGSGRAQMGIFSSGGSLTGRAETNGGRMNVSTTTPTLDTWSHVAVVFDGASLRIYIDGVQGGVTTFSATTLRQTTDPLNFSKRVGTNQYFFDGAIDDVRVYDRALSAAEVLAVANEGDTAVTFGYETINASAQGSVRQIQIATQVTLAEDMTANSITAYVGGLADVEIRYAIYSDVAGEPGERLIQSANDTQPTDAMGWFTISIPDTVLIAGTYWLALSFEDNAQQYQYNSGAGQARYRDHWASDPDSDFLASWGSSETALSREISIFASGTRSNGVSGCVSTYATRWQE